MIAGSIFCTLKAGHGPDGVLLCSYSENRFCYDIASVIFNQTEYFHVYVYGLLNAFVHK